MLQSVRDLENLRVICNDGVACGRIKDVYFDDQTWAIRHIVVHLNARHFQGKQVLLTPEQIQFTWGGVVLNLSSAQIHLLPLASSVLPVCQQYLTLGFGSPAALRLTGCDPHLRSARAVTKYQLNIAGTECGGSLADFIFEVETWEIRFLAVEQTIEARQVNFHVLPQSVERFTWATQRVLLRDLQPVELDAQEQFKVAVA